MLPFLGRKVSAQDARQFIFDVYRAVLDRDPDDEILKHLPAQIKRSFDKLWVFESLLNSDEFKTRRSRSLVQDHKTAEHFIDALLPGRANVKFIQIGVNDAKNADFIRDRATKYGWFGLMVEPHPGYISEAKNNYGEQQRHIWENVAISNAREVAPLYFVKAPPADRPWALGVASFDKEHVRKHGFEDAHISSVDVNCVPLSDMIRKHDFCDVDLLVVDVEGHEVEVMKSIDFERFSVKLVVIETRHMSAETFTEILKLFPKSYRGVFCAHADDSVIYRID